MPDIETQTGKPSEGEVKLTSQEVRELDKLAAALVAQGLHRLKEENKMAETAAQTPVIVAPATEEKGFLDTTAGKVVLVAGSAIIGGGIVYLASGSGSSAVSDIMSR